MGRMMSNVYEYLALNLEVYLPVGTEASVDWLVEKCGAESRYQMLNALHDLDNINYINEGSKIVRVERY